MKNLPIFLLLLQLGNLCAQGQGVQCIFGLEAIPDALLQQLKSKRIGLITNQTGKTQQGKRNIDFLRDRGLRIANILVPEHGLDSTIPAEHDVHDSCDKKTNIPIKSLYTKWSGKNISESVLENLDILLFDIQDSGIRHFTYISTLFYSLKAAATYNKRFIVLDRPNPLGAIMEGPLVEPSLLSFISVAPVPIRHGMTIGELALYFNKHILEKPANLQVVRMQNYNRTSNTKDYFLTKLSPNITSVDSCYGYSFLGLLAEIRPFDVALQTKKSFQAILLPEDMPFENKKWDELKTILKKHKIESSSYRYFSERKKKYCKGLLLQVKDINAVASFELLVTIIDFFKKSGVTITFSQLFNKAIGTKNVCAFFDNKMTWKELADSVNKPLLQFFNRAKDSFLYQPLPTVISIT